MDITALLLSRPQFAFTVSFHIISVFHDRTGSLAHRAGIPSSRDGAPDLPPLVRVLAQNLRCGFRIRRCLRDRHGIRVRHQLERTGPHVRTSSGPLLAYETFTAFALEATFFGVLLFGRQRVAPWFYLFSTAMVALGTTLSAFWIMINNSWMQVPVGYVVESGMFVPNDWTKLIFNSVVWSRFPHMLLAAYLTGAFCVAATGAWYLLREHLPPRQGSWSAWACIWRPCLCRSSSSSGTWRLPQKG
jgi:cytochrome bd ubiquinol oxidase subunit I